MNFCPNCSNILDCIKSTSKIIEKIVIKKVNDLIKIIDNNEDLSNYKAEFNKIEMLENKKYLKYSDNIKKNIDLLFDNSQANITSVEYKCLNCGYFKPILQTSRLYYDNIDNDNSIFIKTLDENALLCSDPLYRRRKDYICKNPNCSTHVQPELKEIILRKNKNSYQINYICCVCNYSW